MNTQFSGKVVLITGASSGIGAASAIAFAKLGASLSLADINYPNLEDTGKECNEISNFKPLLIEANLTKEEEIEMVIDKTMKNFGKLNILLNCAGIAEKGNIESTSLKQFDKIFNVNIRAVYELTRLAVPYLVASKGNIINISSVAATIAYPGAVAYGISKAAISHFTTTLALDLAPKQVRVNCINPGTIATNIFKNAGWNEREISEVLEKAKAAHPIGRIGQTEDIVNGILFLASDKSGFITGVHLPIDGGRCISHNVIIN